MLDKDQILLERAYLTLSKAITPKPQNIPSSREEEEEAIVSSGPVTEPAPGVDVEMIEDENEEGALSDEKATSMEPSEIQHLTNEPETLEHKEEQEQEQEQEEDEMALDNLNSIRESIFKVASFCASGGHLEIWQQQKLAIAMDNLAGVARSLRI